MDNKRIFLSTACLIFVTILCVSSFAANESETNTEAEEHFQKANELHILADYDAAITEYKAVISSTPNSLIAQNAKYWIGQLYYETRQYDAALSTFEELIEEFPTSLVVPKTEIMIERVQQALKNRALFEAIKEEDIEQVEQLIAGGADIDTMWGDTATREELENVRARDLDDTPLFRAADANNIDLVKFLVEAGADVNAGEFPPLPQAIYRGNMAIAKYLIDNGANANYPEDWGPIHEAITTGSNTDIELLELLIEKGAVINEGPGYLPLHLAIWWEKEDVNDIVEFLIQHGADVNAKDGYGLTPLSYTYNLDLMNLLIANGADVNLESLGESILIGAAHSGEIEAVHCLLEAGADINDKNIDGQTALHLAAQNGHTDVAELLLDSGADINARDDESGFTALHYAAQFDNKDTAELLIARGLDVNLKDNDGRTPLHLVAESADADIEIIEFLLEKGADINAKDNQGYTPLYFAVANPYYEIDKFYYEVAELLINRGADSTIETESGITLLELAEEREKIESEVMIFDGDPNSFFGFRMVCGDIDGDGYDDIIIGANRYDNNRGRVYLFYGGPEMDTTADLIFEGQNEGHYFGISLSCGDIDNDGYDDIVIAGRYSENQGYAYLYWGSDRNSIDANQDKVLEGEQEKSSLFGGGIPAIYDIDNDGYDDIIIGDHGYDDATGRAYLYYGNTKELMDTSYDQIFEGEEPGDGFGVNISCGDIDNDSYGDIVIGAGGGNKAYLYYGNSQSNMDAESDAIFESEFEGNDHFGSWIVSIDQNRDGYDDIVIGAYSHNNGNGRAYLFHGNSEENLDTDPDIIFGSESNFQRFGFPDICGDIDGDNIDDLIIGAFGSGLGKAYIYWGNELVASDSNPGRIFTGENPGDQFSNTLACGDINNDGFEDLIIGACGYQAGANQGRAYLYYGGPR